MLTPEKEKEIRELVGHAFNRRTTNEALKELLAEIDRLRNENQRNAKNHSDWVVECQRLKENLAVAVKALKWIDGPHQSENGEDYTDLEFQMTVKAREALSKIGANDKHLFHGNEVNQLLAEIDRLRTKVGDSRIYAQGLSDKLAVAEQYRDEWQRLFALAVTERNDFQKKLAIAKEHFEIIYDDQKKYIEADSMSAWILTAKSIAEQALSKIGGEKCWRLMKKS